MKRSAKYKGAGNCRDDVEQRTAAFDVAKPIEPSAQEADFLFNPPDCKLDIKPANYAASDTAARPAFA